MSYQRALDTIHLRTPAGPGQQENLDHPAFIEEMIGRDPWENPHLAYVEAYRALGVDWVLGIPHPQLARDTFAKRSSIDLGDGARMTEWGLSGSYWRKEFYFQDVEDVLGYDPLVNEPAIPFATVDQGLRTLEATREAQRDLAGGAIVSAMRYPTLFTACIMAFGWPLFMSAAAAEAQRFEHILQGFAEVSRRIMQEWAHARWPLILIHDDIAMQHGMVFRPEWYRQHVFPRYEYILEPLFADPSIRVCFVSDGDYSAVLPDLVAVGFHGFFVNPNMNLGEIARAFGRDHFFVGNVDTAVLTFGGADDVRREVMRCMEEAKPCAGHFIKAMGDLPHNIPLANIRAYFEACKECRG